jgi:hypothetical protein
MSGQSHADAFLSFAHDLRDIQADEPKDGNLYVKRVCALAAKRVAECEAGGLIHVPIEGGWMPQPAFPPPLDDTELWFLSWITVCQTFQNQHPSRVPTSPGLWRWEQTAEIVREGTAESDWEGTVDSVWEGTALDKDWRQRALEYALVCELLADVCGKPATEPSGEPASTNRGKNVNARMLEAIQEDAERIGWNCSDWAKHLRCSTAAVTTTQTWKDLEIRRDRERAERAKDRRQKRRSA